ncbi:MAG TPA: hypothetical protein DCF44_00145 [Chitinophagaceae bacterium]|nr:hypothetical protein [Chitinophagaceae bacterium]
MLLHFRLHYLLFLTLFFVACDKTPKETTVNGVVLDKVTAEPIAGASVRIFISHNTSQPPNNYEEKYIETDNVGHFSFSNVDPFSVFEIIQNGYIPKNSDIPDVKLKELNDMVIKLAPMDGVLAIEMKNTTNSMKSIYLGIYSPILDAENIFSKGIAKKDSFIIDPFDTHVRMFNLASDDSISVYWGFISLPSDIKTLPFQEYVSVTRNDTTTFTISF